jgi:hypothetical protein
MSLQESTEGKRATSRDLIRVLVLLAVAIALMVAATAIFGMGQTGPLYEIVPDPAHLSGLPF